MDIDLPTMYLERITLRGGGNNKVIFRKAFLKRCKINIIGTNNMIWIAEGVHFDNVSIHIYGDNNFINVQAGSFIRDGEIYIEDDSNSIFIGERTAFCGKVQLSCIEGTKINIGKECLLSSDIVFRTGDSHSLLDMNGDRTNISQDVDIKDHVWIGQKAMVLKGVTVCENSIVAAGSVVTKKFKETNVVIGGNPAGVVKRNIRWMHERISIER